jgi:hypothetical protein
MGRRKKAATANRPARVSGPPAPRSDVNKKAPVGPGPVPKPTKDLIVFLSDDDTGDYLYCDPTPGQSFCNSNDLRIHVDIFSGDTITLSAGPSSRQGLQARANIPYDHTSMKTYLPVRRLL